MRKVKSILIALILICSTCISIPMIVHASTPEIPQSESSTMVMVSETVNYLKDGSKITTRIYENPVNTYASTYTKNGQKSLTCEDDKGTALWKYTVTGTFTIESGVSATCTRANGTPTSYDSAWSAYSNNVSRSGNKATGVIRMQEHWMGLVVQDFTETVTLTCSVNGTFS